MVSNLACFMYHWWQECGYNESTRKRIMRSFYIEKAQLAEHSSWDPTTKTATSHFATKSSTYLEDNSDYDPQPPAVKGSRTTRLSIIDMSDQLRNTLLKQLGQDKTPSLLTSTATSAMYPHIRAMPTPRVPLQSTQPTQQTKYSKQRTMLFN